MDNDDNNNNNNNNNNNDNNSNNNSLMITIQRGQLESLAIPNPLGSNSNDLCFS